MVIVIARLRGGWTAPIRRPVSGEGASPRRVWRGWMSGPGRGVPGRFPPAEIAEVKALACELPAQTGRPLSRWSAAELAREAVERGIVCSVSGTTVWRWLSEDAIRTWAWRSCLFPLLPDFGRKRGRVHDLFVLDWYKRRLHPLYFVISVDEKTQLQKLLR